MQDANRKLNGVSWTHWRIFAIDGDDTSSLNNEPMLGAIFVTLIGEALSWRNPDAFCLMCCGFLKNFVATPGAF